MRWDLVARGLLRYSAGYGALTLVLALGLAVLLDVPAGLLALVLLVVAVLTLVLALAGSSGLGTGAHAVEPASGVHVDPREHAGEPIGDSALRAFFWAVGVIAGSILALVLG